MNDKQARKALAAKVPHADNCDYKKRMDWSNFPNCKRCEAFHSLNRGI
jgi:hypothetical protein